jgi:tRNA-splicing ligase RtcB
MRVIDDGVRFPVKCWTDGVELEAAAERQLRNVANLPFVHHHVAAMPDVHWGIGATVGSVIPTVGAVVPAAVGVDIGCGMIAQRTSLAARDLPASLARVRAEIEQAVPHGRSDHGGPNDRGAWTTPPEAALRAMEPLRPGLRALVEKHPKLARAAARAPHHLGTLGTGNHFIELCLDEGDAVWVMLHSGSRGIGNAIGTYFIGRAKQQMKRLHVHPPDADLAWLSEGTEDFEDYVDAVHWAQTFAARNRELMLDATLRALERALGRPIATASEVVNCHHNYVSVERHFGKDVLLTRKGAIRARPGDLGIIPGSMGVQSYIVRGKGNAESFHSCSHGAGRRMSRNEAKRRFTLADHEAATRGVECRKDAGVLDETPGAYKSIDAVMEAQRDLVEVVHVLRQVVCVKG